MRTPSWTETALYALDFEGDGRSGVIEWGVAEVSDGAITQTWGGLCQPRGEVGPAQIRVHGLTMERLAGAPPFGAEWEHFSAWRKAGPLAAHNAAFEQRMLSAEWPCPPYVPDFQRPGQQVATWGPWLDTLRLYRRLYPQEVDFSLGVLIERFQLQEKLTQLASKHCPEGRRKPHCALYDALACGLLITRLTPLEGMAERTLAQFLALGSDGHLSRQGSLFGE